MTDPSNTATEPLSGRKSRARKASRASFGSTRRLPSGRFQARYTDRQMNRHTAPQTFATKREAEDWLATVRADVVRGTWRAPSLGAVTLADYAAEHLATRVDLAPRTQQLYADVLAGWITTPLDLPAAPGRTRGRTVDLGATELSALSVASVRDWHAAATHTARRNAQQRADITRRRREADDRHAARIWAAATGVPVKDTGRLPARVLDAWHAAGAPGSGCRGVDREAAPIAIDAGRAQVAQAYRLLRAILSHAVRDGRIDANPCQLARAGQVKATERTPATPAEVAALAGAMPDRYAAAVHLAAWSGLRAGELFGLARRQVDLEAGTVRVDRAVTYMPGKAPVLGGTKTDSSKRTVHLPPHVVTILREHMDTYTGAAPESLVFPATPEQSARAWARATGRNVSDRGWHVSDKVMAAWREAGAPESITPAEVRKATFWRARAAIGRPDLRWHDLRHTGATLAAQAGATLAELQHRLGHSTTAAAMIYQHHSADRDRALAHRLSLLAEPPTDNVHPIGGRTEASA